MAVIGNMSNKYEGANNTFITDGSFNFDTVVGGASAAAASISTLWSPEGNSSLRINTPAGVNQDLYLASISQGTVTNEMWVDFFLRVTQAPTSGLNTNIMWFHNATSATPVHVGNINIQGIATAGQFNLRLRNASYVATTSSTLTLNLNQDYRIAVHIEPGVATSGTNGLRMYVYTGPDVATTMSPSLSTGTIAANGAIQPVNRMTIGNSTGSTDIGGLAYYIDDIIVDNSDQPVRTPPSTAITAWEENFETGNLSDLLGISNSIFSRNNFSDHIHT